MKTKQSDGQKNNSLPNIIPRIVSKTWKISIRLCSYDGDSGGWTARIHKTEVNSTSNIFTGDQGSASYCRDSR